MGQRQFYVYILSSISRTLYIGVTNNLERRLHEHRMGPPSSFTVRYNVFSLVYVETYRDPTSAIGREKQLKGWRRAKKLSLAESTNPDWHDLSADWAEA